MADLFGHEAPPVAPGFVEITGELRSEMRDAIAIVIPDREGVKLSNQREPWVWLPLSEIKQMHRGQRRTVTITIPDWLAKEKGLL